MSSPQNWAQCEKSTDLDVYTIWFALVSNEIGTFYFLPTIFENLCPSSEAVWYMPSIILETVFEYENCPYKDDEINNSL